ncbi:MAG: hypothetical protein R3C59_28940 [Planctomycetaceae bacterium]
MALQNTTATAPTCPPSNNEETTATVSPRTWFHFRWKLLLLIPLLLAVSMFWLVWGQQRQQAVIADLKTRGAILRTEAVPIPFFEQMVGPELSQQIIEVYWVGQDVAVDDLAALADASTLRKLELTKSAVDGAGLQHLTKLGDLYTLHLSGTNVADDALTHVAHLNGLEVLSLNGTRISDAGLENLEHLYRLERLFLDSTAITDVGLNHIATMTQLKELSLKNLPITDAGLLKLTGLVNLEILALDNNPNLTREGIVALRKTIPRLVFSLDEEGDSSPAMQRKKPENNSSETG